MTPTGDSLVLIYAGSHSRLYFHFIDYDVSCKKEHENKLYYYCYYYYQVMYQPNIYDECIDRYAVVKTS